MTLIPYGPKNWLIHWGSRTELEADGSALLCHIESSPPAGLLECVPGYQSILLMFDHPCPEQTLQEYFSDIRKTVTPDNYQPKRIEIPVRYDGPDLNLVAEMNQLTESEVVNLHSAPTYTVVFMGFSPGFPYLGPLDPQLHTPRRSSPRDRIQAGAVAIGGSHTGIYSVASPGGWNIIGHTEVPLFHMAAAQTVPSRTRDIFTLHPGDQVKLIPQSGASPCN